MTAADTILLAAATLPACSFTIPDLAVAAWKIDPKRFGLRGYADRYPDSKAVSVEIMSNKPSSLCPLGLIQRVAVGFYILTEAGWERAQDIRRLATGTAAGNGKGRAA